MRVTGIVLACGGQAAGIATTCAAVAMTAARNVRPVSAGTGITKADARTGFTAASGAGGANAPGLRTPTIGEKKGQAAGTGLSFL